MKIRAGAIAAVLVLTTPVCSAQTLEALDEAEERLIKIWNATPLSFRRAVFVSEDPQGFGVFSERKDNVFERGEPLIVYAEPVGYAWRDNGNGSYTFGFDIDFLLKKPDGLLVAGQENFQHVELTSLARNREFMLTLTLTVDGAAPGDYVLEYRTRDIASDKAGSVSLPFTIAE